MDIIIFGAVVVGLFFGIYLRWRKEKKKIDWEIKRVK